MKSQKMFAFAALGLLLLVARPVQAQFKFTTIDVPASSPLAPRITQLRGINAQGDIVGQAFNHLAEGNGFLRSK